jgi:hypothetical protein
VPKLELQVSFGEHISTQADFDAMLTTGLASPPPGVSPLKTIHGVIDPGETRNIPITVDLKAIAAIDQATRRCIRQPSRSSRSRPSSPVS